MRSHMLCLLGALSCVTGACDRDAPTASKATPMSTSSSPPPSDTVDPARLPAIEPASAPASSVQGLALEVDGARRQVTLRNDGPSTRVGQTVFVLVWVGSGPAEAHPWRKVGTLARGCAAPDDVEPAHTHRGAIGPASSVTWELPVTPAQLCADGELRALPAPPGHYRIGATFRSEPPGTELALWSMPFELTR